MISRGRVAPREFPDHSIVVVNNHTNARNSVTFSGVKGTSPTSYSNGSAGVYQEDELSACIEWFRENLPKVAKHGRVTLKEFKQAAKVLDVSLVNYSVTSYAPR